MHKDCNLMVERLLFWFGGLKTSNCCGKHGFISLSGNNSHARHKNVDRKEDSDPTVHATPEPEFTKKRFCTLFDFDRRITGTLFSSGSVVLIANPSVTILYRICCTDM
ncbi:hypothetical protein L1987_60573 [Smallanthus sonchifolius]|uniref:Uncharacterized protein n=1 Tax=Smallanthus sonchifolius TaxID=185202 RepID=A0ACB9D8K1_9ASTR|nr:hypothetical protein L1987_60573 [Smallanthus sonchifolius]